VDVPVSASVSASTGLLVGGAAVMQVGQYLKSYETGAPNPLLVTNNGVVITNDLVLGPNLQYVVTSINTNLAATPSAYPLRLIVQNPEAGSAVLLQRVYYGLDGSTNPVVATYEGALNRDYINEARRISTSHLPWTAENRGWIFNGLLGVGETVTASVTNLFNNQVSNPFLHTYHPDHDNLNARFSAEVPRGRESYTVIRDITLNVTPPGDDFESRTAGGRTLSGDYVETIRMLGQGADVRQFETRGFFTLNLITDVAVLTTAP
jgi:hypothetical protein